MAAIIKTADLCLIEWTASRQTGSGCFGQGHGLLPELLDALCLDAFCPLLLLVLVCFFFCALLFSLFSKRIRRQSRSLCLIVSATLQSHSLFYLVCVFVCVCVCVCARALIRVHLSLIHI